MATPLNLDGVRATDGAATRWAPVSSDERIDGALCARARDQRNVLCSKARRRHTLGVERRPPELQEHGEWEEPSDATRGNWVEQILGGDWKSDGDGIYRYMPEPEARPRSRPRPDSARLSWTLECGHEVPVLPHEQPDEPPLRPRMCLKCGEMRKVNVEP